MKNFYKNNFAINSPIILILLIGTLVLGFWLRWTIQAPMTINSSHVESLSRLGMSTNFVTASSKFFGWLEFALSILTILVIYFLGQSIAGKTAGISSAFIFAVYPYFSQGLYSINIFVIFSFTLYLLFMYIGVHSMNRVWNLLSGILFIIACMLEPAILILGILPYIYLIIKQKHVAVLNSFLFFLIGVLIMLGLFAILALSKGNIANFMPISDSVCDFVIGIKSFFAHPIIYSTETIWPYLKGNFAYPLIGGDFSYIHYFIITLSILGLLYSFVHENIRILSILFVVMLLQAFFMPYSYALLLTMLTLITGFMVDKVIKDAFEL